MILSRNARSLALLLAAFLITTAMPHLHGQEARKPSPEQAQKIAPVPSRVWKSETSGREYRVWMENQRFHAEWVNIPAEFVAQGAYIRTVCWRAGQKWIGESRSYRPCSVGEGKEEHIANWCHVTTGFELDSVTENRISGRGEGLKRFDCRKCQVIEKVWKSFVWVPKPQGPPAK